MSTRGLHPETSSAMSNTMRGPEYRLDSMTFLTLWMKKTRRASGSEVQAEPEPQSRVTGLGRSHQRNDRRGVISTEPDSFARARMPAAGRAPADVHAGGFGNADNSRPQWEHEVEPRQRNSKFRCRVQRRIARVSLRIHVAGGSFAADGRALIETIVAVQLFATRSDCAQTQA